MTLQVLPLVQDFNINKMNIHTLMVPIYELHFINSLDDIIFNEGTATYFKDQNSLTERKELYENLVWAQEHPEYDFKSITKDAPIPNELSFSNEEVHRYLMDFKKFMEDKIYEMLSDDRPPHKY